MKALFLQLRVHWKYLAGGILGLLMLAQIFYPANRLPLHSYLGDTAIGARSRSDIKSELEKRQNPVTILFNGKAVTFNPGDAGINLDVEKTMASLPSLRWYERVVPLWPFVKAVPRNTTQSVINRDEHKLAEFATKLTTDQRKDPVNASAVIQNETLTFAEAQPGEDYSSDQIKQTLQTADLFTSATPNLEPHTTRAAVYIKDFGALKDEFTAASTQQLKVSYGTTSKDIDKRTVTSWLIVVPNPETSIPELRLKTEALEPFIQEWNKEYTVAPGVTQLSLVDNAEVARRTGASGRALNVESIREQIAGWIKKPISEPLVLTTKVLTPTVVATRTYSQSSAGLLAKLTYWLQTHSGKYQVAIRELGGQGREASYNVSQQTVMASTYKPFLAFVAYKQAESGALNLGSNLTNGKNIEQCMEIMIVNSDNDCAVALGKLIGWAKVDEIIAGAGFVGVRLNNYNANGSLNGDKLVNAREQANFLAQLSGGLLVNPTNTAKLISYMKRQIYRDGIPAGSMGASVADKVGFLEGYIHDVGIVYAPNATYALVIMSEGSSWTNISDLSRAIYDFMNE